MDGSSIRTRLLGGFVAMLIVIAIGTSGFWWLGDGRWSLLDCLYMTVITITTVGYGETLPGMDHMPAVRVFTMVQLVFGTGVLVYFASTITAFVVEGELQAALAQQRLRKRIKKMKDHIVVCGAGSTGRNVIDELLKVGASVIGVDRDETGLRELAARHPNAHFTFLVGDATDDDVLGQLNLDGARGLVAALSADKDNLYLVVAARQVGPKLRIIARCAELSHVDKLKRAGADSVVSPNFIGGMRMVSEMVRPSVVRFMDDMLRDKRAAYRIEEVTVGAESALAGRTIRQAAIRQGFGMNVIAARAADADSWDYNPDAELTLRAGTVLVVCGSAEQVARLRAHAR
jgi:voltage-gated potassium channel